MERGIDDTLDHLNEPAAVFEHKDEIARLVLVNKASLALLSCTADQLEGVTHEELLVGTIHPDDRDNCYGNDAKPV